jgi:hypothetical protein
VSFILTQVFQGNAVTLQGRANNGNPTACPSLNAKDYGGMGQPPTPSGDCGNAVSYHGQALAAQTAAIALLIPGAIIGVTGIIMFIAGGNVTKTPEKPAPAASLRIVPAISPTYAGVGLVGTF